MNLNVSNEQNIIERDVHCPYCQSDHALLISGIAEKRSVIQLPDYGLKYWLSVYFTFGVYMLLHGFPMLEKRRIYDYQTYGFCPNCGKSYHAGVSAAAKAARAKVPRFYRSVEQRKIFGLCGGVAEYTGLSVTLVRVATILYGFTFLPAVIYFALGLLNIIPENPKQLNHY